MQDFRTTADPHHAELRPLPRRRPREAAASTRAATSRCARPSSAPSPTPRRRAARSRTAWASTVYNSYGLSEMNGPGVAFECEQRARHAPVGGPLPDGDHRPADRRAAAGRRARRAGPDHAHAARPCRSCATARATSPRIVEGRCPCGRTHRRIERITGRADDMLIVRGVNIYPQQIERVLMGMPELGRNYLIVLEGLDEMTVQVELSPQGFDGRVEHLVHLQARDRREPARRDPGQAEGRAAAARRAARQRGQGPARDRPAEAVDGGRAAMHRVRLVAVFVEDKLGELAQTTTCWPTPASTSAGSASRRGERFGVIKLLVDRTEAAQAALAEPRLRRLAQRGAGGRGRRRPGGLAQRRRGAGAPQAQRRQRLGLRRRLGPARGADHRGRRPRARRRRRSRASTST